MRGGNVVALFGSLSRCTISLLQIGCLVCVPHHILAEDFLLVCCSRVGAVGGHQYTCTARLRLLQALCCDVILGLGRVCCAGVHPADSNLPAYSCHLDFREFAPSFLVASCSLVNVLHDGASSTAA
jgi:hypothetical protein